MMYEVSNLLSKEQCDKLIHYFKRNQHECRTIEYPALFDKKTITPQGVGSLKCQKILRAFEFKATQAVSKSHDCESYVFMEHWDIVHWNPGMEMTAHRDNQYDPKIDLSARHYSAVCYLNDDYTGGTTFFSDGDATNDKTLDTTECIPETGKMVSFKSDVWHGVNKVTSGDRYTIAMWFTCDETRMRDKRAF